MSKSMQIFSLQPWILRCFSRSLEHFFLTVGQNNFRNKIPLQVIFDLVPAISDDVFPYTGYFEWKHKLRNKRCTLWQFSPYTGYFEWESKESKSNQNQIRIKRCWKDGNQTKSQSLHFGLIGKIMHHCNSK